MPKAQITFHPKNSTSAVWAGDGIGHENLLPGGVLVDETEFTAGSDGRKYIPSGTLLGRTDAEAVAGTGFGLADVANDDEIYLLVFDCYDALKNDEVELYRHNRLVYKNFLPDWGTYTATEKAWIEANYECMYAVD